MNKMNQTQTRSPRKRLLSLILAVILMIGLLPISAFATSASAQAGEDKAATQDSEFLRISTWTAAESISPSVRSRASSISWQKITSRISSWPSATTVSGSC